MSAARLRLLCRGRRMDASADARDDRRTAMIELSGPVWMVVAACGAAAVLGAHPLGVLFGSVQGV